MLLRIQILTVQLQMLEIDSPCVKCKRTLDLLYDVEVAFVSYLLLPESVCHQEDY